MWQILTAGLTLGMISSFHCMGMCGPLALSLPVSHLTRTWRILSILLYHMGRVLTYTSLGLLFGLLGRRIYIAGFQQGFSISMGVFMLILTIGYGIRRNAKQPLFMGKFYHYLQNWIIRLWQSPGKSKFLLLGAANGLLPCGMVYLAIAGALNATRVWEGGLFMACFGAGTLPLMLGLSFIGRRVHFSFRNIIKRGIPFLVGGMAILLILRGLNLGIPFVSPVLSGNPGQVISCH